MNRLNERLQPWIEAEAGSPGPPPDAVTDCWARIVADVERGSFPEVDVRPPPAPRAPHLWLVVMLLGAGLAGVIAYAAQSTSDPVATDPPLAPAPVIAASSPSPAPAIAAPSAVPSSPSLPTVASSRVADPPLADPALAVQAVATRSRPRTANTAVEADTFTAELRLLAAGQSALSSDDHAGALRIADQYQRTYPKGHFTEDRDALRALALCGAGAPKAAAAARRFLRAYPNSIHAARVRNACEQPTEVPVQNSP